MSSSSIGTGVIELVADSRKFSAGISDAKKSLRDLGDFQTGTTNAAKNSIDQYIKRLEVQNKTLGLSSRETQLLQLSMKGASAAQVAYADNLIRTNEAHQQSIIAVQNLREGFISFAKYAVIGIGAAVVAAELLIHKIGGFQEMATKVGDTAENFASLAVSAAVGGTSMDAVATASAKLTKALTGVDDDSVAAGAAIESLGLNLADFKKLAPADQFEAVAKALAGFQDGTAKTAVAMALFGKAGAEMLPFLKLLGEEGGRQTILTSEQIRLAHEHAEAQARLREQISLYAGAIVSSMLPAYNDLTGAMLQFVKDAAGVTEGAKGLANDTAILDFANDAVKQFGRILDAVNGLVVGFRVVGNIKSTISGMVTTLLDPTSGKSISERWNALSGIASEGAAKQHDLLMADTPSQRIAAARARREGGGDTNQTPPKDRPDLVFKGPRKKDTSAAEQEARAQLAFDLDQIKKHGDETANAFANAEKVMESLRSANLVDDKTYYAEKQRFLKTNAENQEASLQDQIARMEREHFTGKDAAKNEIDNNRKIADTVAALTKVRADAAANSTIIGIQEAAAAAKIAQSLKDSTEASDQYIASIVRRNAAELAGVGKGDAARGIQAGVNAIDDRFTVDRQKIERDKRNNPQNDPAMYDALLAKAKSTYDEELDIYKKHTTDMIATQSNWVNGANEAMSNYIADSKNIAKQTEEVWTKAFKGAEDALVQFIETGKFSMKDLKSLFASISSEMTRNSVKQLMGGLMGSAKGEGGGMDWMGAIGKMFGGGGGGGGGAEQLSGPGMSSGGGGGGGMDWFGNIAKMFGFAEGTGYVPATGPYILHKGEAVIPAAENSRGGGGAVYNLSVVQNFNVPAGVTKQTQLQIAAQAQEGLSRAQRNM